MPRSISLLQRLSMADAMRIFGLTARALRFYEEKGLIEAQRDRLNFRYFDADAARRIEWIAQLRSAGIGLADIREVLGAESAGQAANKIAARKLSARRRELVEEIARIDGVAARLNGVPSASIGCEAHAIRTPC